MAKKKSTKKSARVTASASFEESLAALEQIVSKLESGKLELADSLDQYEQGVGHLKACYRLLNDAEQRIRLVSEVDESGKVRSEVFAEDQEPDLQKKAAARGKRRTAKQDDPGALF